MLVTYTIEEKRYINLHCSLSLMLISYGLVIFKVLIWKVKCPYYYDCPLLLFDLLIIIVVVLVNINVVLLYYC